MQVLLIMNSNAIVCNCVIASPRLLLLHSRSKPSQISPIKAYQHTSPLPAPDPPSFWIPKQEESMLESNKISKQTTRERRR
ncbi:hypothetical protein FIBSPDRAFT_77729 [Athelia psychrophila]|uniref:Uncharacterized protein n=1 Tax=Athelia psychrophila TaxID=1759441 RepID=A0A166EHJ9_9AGAM|nr:hypothetical protein FIBSPDRAFT_77729 [Fibularhizoctonia sp. CBS 109695]